MSLNAALLKDPKAGGLQARRSEARRLGGVPGDGVLGKQASEPWVPV